MPDKVLIGSVAVLLLAAATVLTVAPLNDQPQKVEVIEGDPQAALSAVHSVFGPKAGVAACITLDRSTANKSRSIAIHTGSAPCNRLSSDPAVRQLLTALETLSARGGALSVHKYGAFIQPDNEWAALLVRVSDSGTPAIAGIFNGRLGIQLLAPDLSYGSLPPHLMSDHREGTVDAGILLAHELGHVTDGLERAGEARALALENLARRLRDPAAPTRLLH